MRALLLLVAAALAGGSARAGAPPSITLNGVPIDGVTSQRFENCTVTIDERGNVHIDAKGYVVKGADAPAGPTGPTGPTGATGATGPAKTAAATDGRPVNGKLSRRYFLATEHAAPGTQYDLAIFINAQWIREVKATERQAVMEITKYLRPGPNKVTLAATKRAGGERVSSPDVQLRVVIGEGNVGGDHVLIDVPLVEAVRTAAETEDRTEEFVVDAR
jgi:hypothetical protein